MAYNQQRPSPNNSSDRGGTTYTKVGQFILLESLGEGSYSQVRLAKHEHTGQEYAVKVIDKSVIQAHGVKDNVRREIEIMYTLKHRNIVNLHHVLRTASRLYLVMDLVRGGDLFLKIERNRNIPIADGRKYFQQLVDGVHYCHNHGIYHRDLKPENLLLRGDGLLKITDFGVSSIRQGRDIHYTTCGTPFYCAPEIFTNTDRGYSGAKIDAWSCGIILYLLVTGSLPFFDSNFLKLAEEICRKDLEYPPGLDRSLKQLIKMLLQKDPRKRYTMDDVKKHSWFLVDYEGNSRKTAEMEENGGDYGEAEEYGLTKNAKSLNYRAETSGQGGRDGS